MELAASLYYTVRCHVLSLPFFLLQKQTSILIFASQSGTHPKFLIPANLHLDQPYLATLSLLQLPWESLAAGLSQGHLYHHGQEVVLLVYWVIYLFIFVAVLGIELYVR